MKKLIAFSLLFFFCIYIFPQASKKELPRYQILVGSDIEYFYEPYHRNLLVTHYGFGIKHQPLSIFFKFNSGYFISEQFSFNSADLQLEFDSYLRITKGTNLWVNYAYSDKMPMVFPEHRFFFLLSQNLPYSFIISGGSNNFWFNNHIILYSAGLEKYYGNFSSEFKTYIISKEDKTKFSYQLINRYYWKDMNFFQLTIGTGFEPDQFLSFEHNQFNSYSIKTLIAVNIQRNWRLRAGTGVSYEKYNMDSWRVKFGMNISVTYNLRQNTFISKTKRI